MLVELLRADGRRVVVLDSRSGDDIRRPRPNAVSRLREAEVVVLAVPEDVALAVVESLPPLMNPSALLVETLSVKTRFADCVAHLGDELAWDGPIVGINPMFAPSLRLPGRTVAAVVHRSGRAADLLLDDLRRWGARVQIVSADHHDRSCAAVQALTHATILSFGCALADLGIDPDGAAALATPVFTTMSALLARVSGGTPEVYRDVQVSNPYARAAREALSRAISCVSAASRAEAGVAGFADLLDHAGLPLGDHADDQARLCARLFEGLAS